MLVPSPIPLIEKFLYLVLVFKLLKVKPVELVKLEDKFFEKFLF